MNEQILSGLADEKLETAATTLVAMKRNLLAYLKADSA
jgi:hypothetical protein